MKKRSIELLVLSDIHLGTLGCHAKELHLYMQSISPKKVVLNGDIIDIWQFKKRYWPAAHMKIIKQVFEWVSEGIDVTYITGNHDELFRKFVGFRMGKLAIENKLTLELDGKMAWFFHGDVFDVTMKHSKWLVRLGAVGYDALIFINHAVNSLLKIFGRERISLSKKIKDKVKGAVSFINNFEATVTDIAMEKGFDYVICGHIHKPAIKSYSNLAAETVYLNSGDWVENLTALEYDNQQWNMYKFNPLDFPKKNNKSTTALEDLTTQTPKQIFNELVKEFNL